VAIVLSYLATALTVILAGVVISDPINAVLMSFSIVAAIFVCETILELPAFREKEGPLGPEWVGQLAPHPRLGMVYPPNSVLKTYYPDDPRGYFEMEDQRVSRWGLRVAGGSEASLVFPPDDPELVRIEIRRAETKSGFDIQLNQPRLKVKSNHRYTIAFRARADRPRSIVLGFSMAHEPWSGIGLYKRIKLTPEWQSFQEDFIATADDDNARIHFDAGDSDIPVELSSVSLRGLTEGDFIKPDLSHHQYFVSYKFNALGCRGRDYKIPRPPGTGRILLLGDSFTLGVGVHEKDTFGNQLEHLLNERAEASASFSSYEVVNCGVSGFGTREERLFYEEFGAKYEPDIVLLVMVSNDDMSFLDEVEKGYVLRRPGKFETLSHIWGKVEEYRHRRPFPDYRASIDEIFQLDSEVRERGARLAVVIFRSSSDYGGDYNAKVWDHLTRSVMEGLRGTDIPLLDLGPSLLEKHPGEQLLVHEIDGHPNEIAHKTAAQEILEFLKGEGLLRPN
jgi:hypothetical protein